MASLASSLLASLSSTFNAMSNSNNGSPPSPGSKFPSAVSGVYKEDFDIRNVHRLILEHFNQDQTEHLTLLEQRLELEQQRVLKRQSPIERKASRKNIEKLQKEIAEIKSEREIRNYLEEAGGLIEKYTELGVIPKVVSFASNVPKEMQGEDFETQDYRHWIISKYLEIARKYIDISIIREEPNIDACPVCFTEWPEESTDDDTVQLCKICGLEREIIARAGTYHDSSRICTSNSNNYKDRENFYKAMLKYQGRQPNNLPPDMFDILDSYFRSYGMPVSSEVKLKPLDRRGRRQGTNSNMLLEALSATGFAAFYEDKNLICHLYWGWLLPDISKLEMVIMQDYDDSQREINMLESDRKSCLNCQFRLFNILRRHGHECEADDFKIVKTPDIIDYHEKVWKYVSERRDWPYKPVF